MRPFTELRSFSSALQAVVDAARPISREQRIPIAASDGRVVARDVVAHMSVPPFDRAAMDGYAVRDADTAGATSDAPRRLTRSATLFSGDEPAATVEPGQCVEIATGAPLPPGATAVVMVEHTRREGDHVDVLAPVSTGQNVGRRGSDIGEGQVLVSAREVMTPSRIGALAAVGVEDLTVFEKPSVAVVSTGNELVSPGQPLAPGQIYDVNQFTLAAVVARHGGIAAVLPMAGDSIEALHAALDAVARHDIAVFSGGSSVGDRDLLVDAVAARGTVHFHGIAVKPGKPTLFATVGNTFVFGMPGYPTSCLSNAHMLLVPLLRATARLPPWSPQTATLPLSRRVASTPDRHQFYTVRVVDGQAEPAFKASGDITSMAHADGFIEIPAGVAALEAGARVVVRFF